MIRTTLTDWLTSIESLHSSTIDLTLSRITQVADRLHLRNKTIPIVTVAGTNGKGTTVALLKNILQQSKFMVGTFTSPHLLHFNERITIHDRVANDAEIIAAFESIELARANITLTYFEYTFLAALIIFKQHPLDLLILEVGLGGRLDAVNILDTDIALITSIDLDHMDYLGDSREAIGAEKAGIFRQNKPAICGELPTNSIVEHAKKINAVLEYPYRDFVAERVSDAIWKFRNKKMIYNNLPYPNIPFSNAVLALQAISHLHDQFPISVAAIQHALKNTAVSGRFECYKKNGVMIILDVAHNPHATRYLNQQLNKQHCGGKTFAVVSMLADKAIADSIHSLKNTVDHWFFAGLPVERGLSADTFTEAAHITDKTIQSCFESVELAYEAAQQLAQSGDRIIVFGSFYTVAAVMPLLVSKTNNPTEKNYVE